MTLVAPDSPDYGELQNLFSSSEEEEHEEEVMRQTGRGQATTTLISTADRGAAVREKGEPQSHFTVTYQTRTASST